MLEALNLPLENDYATVEWLGNTGSVALPITMALGLEHGFVQRGENVGMLGIGSGINCLMVAAKWQESRVRSQLQGACSASGQSDVAAEFSAGASS
jgi:3-oxoacyl-[acyl-carrier-protein] synthase-3